jgi:hypothetical protein
MIVGGNDTGTEEKFDGTEAYEGRKDGKDFKKSMRLLCFHYINFLFWVILNVVFGQSYKSNFSNFFSSSRAILNNELQSPKKIKLLVFFLLLF